MDLTMMDLENQLISTLQHMLPDISDDDEAATDTEEPTITSGRRAYVRERKAMASTPADVKEYPNSYVFSIDMPGVKASEVKAQVEDENVLVVRGKRRRSLEEDKEGVGKYLRMERRRRRFMRKFRLPENANTDAILAVCRDGVLIVTVPKKAPLEPKKAKTMEVTVA